MNMMMNSHRDDAFPKMLGAVSHVLANISDTKPTFDLFDDILSVLLDLTESEYGFIGEVLESNDGQPYLKAQSISDISWNQETREFYETYAPDGLEFYNLKSLWGAAITSGKPVISNSPKTDARRGGTPKGHPALNAFIGLPLWHDGELVGMMGLANRQDGYDQEMVQFLEPLLKASAAVIAGRRSLKWRDKNEALLKAATEVAIVSTDTDGIIQSFNNGAEKMLGYTAEEVVGKLTPALLHDEQELIDRAAELSQMLGREISGFEIFTADTGIGGAEERTWKMYCKDGSYRYLGITVTCIKNEYDNEVTGYLAIGRDMTDQLQFELELLRRTDQLEQQKNELIEARDRARTADQTKSEFLANMSHEIRTPMTAILGFTDILLENLQDSECLDAARTIRENGNYLIDLINDILDLSKIEAEKCEIEQVECHLRSFVDDLVSLMKVRSNAKNLPLVPRYEGILPEVIHTDSTRLRQILINLVGNAIKFTETGSVEIVVRMIDVDSEKPRLQFDVIDTGIGIDQKHLSKIFSPFSQADNSATRGFGGTGLGLTISQRLAKLLEGKISVESTLGKGSTFSLVMTTGETAGSTGSSPQDSSGQADKSLTSKNETMVSLAGRRILLAEDGPDNQKLIRFLLKKVGAEVSVADNGQVAFKLAMAAQEEGSPFDVILMDMQMPVMDGYGAARRLRHSGYDRPIIALTAHAMSGDRQKCIEAGCNDYTTKPIDKKLLYALVSQYSHSGQSAVAQ